MLSTTRHPAVRTGIAFALQLISGGIWAMIDPAFVTRNAVRLVIAGVIILAIVWGWDEIRSYIKYKRQKEAPPNRTIYVAMNREPLPGQFPGDGTISIFSITPVGDENGIHSDIGWSVARARCGAPPFEWHDNDPHPWGVRLVITNHSDETLISLRLTITIKVSRPIQGRPHGLHETFVEKDQVLSLDRLRAGEDHPTTTYILNETPWSVDMYIKGAAAAGLHDEAVSDIGVRTDGVPSVIMFLGPAKRYNERKAAE